MLFAEHSDIEIWRKFISAIMTKIRFKLSPKPSKAQKKQEGKTGFVPVKARLAIVHN